MIAQQRELLSRMRSAVEAKDAENAALRAELEAARERERRLGCGWRSWSAGWGWTAPIRGLPSSKEPIGAKQARRAQRQESERERRKDRKRGGQPGHREKGPRRDPDPDENKDRGTARGVPPLRHRPG